MEERLLQFLNAHNLSSTKLADQIGVQRSSISHIVSGRNKPSYDFIYKFLQHYPNISSRWLILGEGPMYLTQTQASLTFEEPTAQSTPRESSDSVSGSQKLQTANSEREKTDQKIQQDRKIKRIVIFYNDNHFEEYTPEPEE